MTIKLYASRPKHHTTCPVTGGCPTRMLETRFRALCAKNREDEESFCYITCRGELLPAGLEFITIETIEEENMSNVKYTPGNCQLCGKSANLKHCLGKHVCASCDFVWRSINAKPESVLEALREKMGVEWLQEKFLAEVQVMKPGMAISAEIDALKHQLECRAVELSAAIEAKAKLEDESVAVREELTAAYEKIREMSSSPVAALSSASLGRADVLLDLALGVLTGRVVGVDAATIYSLRQ